MTLLFVFDMPIEHELFWRDGLWAALKELEKEWHISYLNINKYHDWEKRILNTNADFILGWGGPNSTHFLKVWAHATARRAAWCFGGGDLFDNRLNNFPVVFVENESFLVKPNFKHAFGTNTDLFTFRSNPKIIDALYPAAFANWKHQEKFAQICEKEHLKGLAVGFIQRDNLAESMGLMMECIQHGVAVLDWIPAESLALLYNMSKQVIITADSSGGSERAVLEAKASDVPVRIESDSKRLLDLNDLSTQEVREKWNHLEYARKLKEGILACKQ